MDNAANTGPYMGLISWIILVDLIQRLVPAPDRGDDFVWVGGPGEGLRLLIVVLKEAVDRGLQVVTCH